MIGFALTICIAVAVNCVYAVSGLCAAAHYGIRLSLARGAGLGVLLAGTAVECAALASAHGIAAQLPLFVAFGAVVTGAACDAACGYVFDSITLPCLLIMCASSVVFQAFAPFALGVLAAGGSLGVLYLATWGRGLGLGDVKLACCIGGAAGALGGLEAVGAAFVLGGAYAAFLLVTKRASPGAQMRFAPYLAAGMALVVLYGAAL